MTETMTLRAQDGWLQVPKRELRAVAALVLAIVLPTYLLTANWTVVQTNDSRSAALAGWTLASTGSLALNPEWPPEDISWGVDGRDGRMYSNRFPGIIAVAAIAYAVPVAAGWVPSSSDADHPLDLSVGPATVTAALIAALAVFATFTCLRGFGFPLRIASIGAATVAFGSPVWSVSADALWTHGVTHVSLLCALIAIKKGKAGGAALWFGISVLTRPHLIVVPLILTLFRLDRRVLLGGVAGGLAGLGLSGLYSLVVFGRIIPSGGYNVDGLSQSAPLRSAAGLAGNIWDWLADPLHGIVVWVPLALIAAVGVPLVWRNLDPLIRAAAVAGMAYAAAQLSLIRASGGNIFLGHRTTIETFVLATPLIVASLWALMSSSRAARVLISTLIAYSVAIHAYAAWIDMHPFVREFIEDLQSRMRSDQS